MIQKYVVPCVAAVLALCFGSRAGAQWLSSDENFNGSINALLASDSEVIAASSGGVFRSTDNGADWNAIDVQFSQSNAAYSLARIGPDLLAGTSDGGGIYRTSNEGGSWTELNAGLACNNVYALAVEGSLVVAGTDQGVFLSNDSGSTWHAVDTGLPPHSIVVAMKASGTTLFAATESAVFRSMDGAKTWQAANNGLGTDSALVVSFTTIDSNGSTLVFAGASSDVYRSSDNGNTWTGLSGGFPGDAFFNLLASSGNYLFAGSNGSGAYYSADAGSDWAAANDGLGDPTVYAMAANSTYAFAGTFSGVSRRAVSNFNPSSVSDPRSMPTELSAYPNPLSQSTTIAFTVPESGVSDISVVNTLGTEVARIYSGELSAGAHSLQWNARGLPVGMYVCVVRMNGVVERVPMVVLGH